MPKCFYSFTQCFYSKQHLRLPVCMYVQVCHRVSTKTQERVRGRAKVYLILTSIPGRQREFITVILESR